jgi:hypothetical protein
MRKTIAALLAAGLLLAAACGGDDDDAADKSGGGGGSGGASSSEFCQQAKQVFTNPGNDTNAALDALDALHPPDQIADDWDTMVAGTRDALDAAESVDVNDPDAAAQLSEQYQDVIAASGRIQAYMSEKCGLEDLGPSTGSPDLSTGSGG